MSNTVKVLAVIATLAWLTAVVSAASAQDATAETNHLTKVAAEFTAVAMKLEQYDIWAPMPAKDGKRLKAAIAKAMQHLLASIEKYGKQGVLNATDKDASDAMVQMAAGMTDQINALTHGAENEAAYQRANAIKVRIVK